MMLDVFIHRHTGLLHKDKAQEIIHCRAKEKRGHTLSYFIGPPLALITYLHVFSMKLFQKCHKIYFHALSVIQSFIFHRDLTLMMVESHRCTTSCPTHPKDSQWGEGMDSVVASPWEKNVSCSLNCSFTT